MINRQEARAAAVRSLEHRIQVHSIRDLPPHTTGLFAELRLTPRLRGQVGVLVAGEPDATPEQMLARLTSEPPRSIPITLAVTERVDADRGLFSAAVAEIRSRLPAARLKVIAVMHEGTLLAIAPDPEFGQPANGKPPLPEAPASEQENEFDRLARAAYARKASDIHIEVDDSRAQIRMRVHGLLVHYRDVSPEWARTFVRAAYNALCEGDSRSDQFNERACQNAAVERSFEYGKLRFRYASMPTAGNGFDVTLRLLPIGVEERHLTHQEMGYHPSHVRLIQRAFARSSGMTVIAGTTGSGKSTTLKHTIEWIAQEKPAIKIRTIEEPVEYRIRGARQTPVVRNDRDDENGRGGNPFLPAIRAAMRSDPDFIMVGEIRDLDTAILAIQGVQTGHQIATTIHADSAIGIVDRLALMGIDRRVLAQVDLISAFMYQKLVPTLCPHCRLPYAEWRQSADFDAELDRRIRRVYFAAGSPWQVPEEAIFLDRRGGCQHCLGYAVAGRTVASEVIMPTRAMLRAFASGDSVSAWQTWRRGKGDGRNDLNGRTAFEHAVLKVTSGNVSPRHVEELFRELDEALDLDAGFDEVS